MRVLITGAGGQLGQDLVAAFAGRDTTSDGRVAQRASASSATFESLDERSSSGMASLSPAADGIPEGSNDVFAFTHDQLDVVDRDAVHAVILGVQPDVVVHAGAWTDVDGCELDPRRAFAVNSLGTRHVAEVSRRIAAHVCYVSTDYVFDGRMDRGYTEWDEPNPLSVYGRSKLGGEGELDPEWTIIRTSWVFSHRGRNILKTVLSLLDREGPIRFVNDQRGCPTFTGDLAWGVARLARDRRPGVYHVTNQGIATWFEFARTVVRVAGGDLNRIEPITTDQLDPPRPAPRPANSVLDNAALALEGIPLLPHWSRAVEVAIERLRDDLSARESQRL